MLGIKIKDLKIYIDGSETTTNFKTESFGFQDFHYTVPDFGSAQSAKNLVLPSRVLSWGCRAPG